MGSTFQLAAPRDRSPWLWLHLASLVGILGVLVYVNSGQWFFGDEWDFLLKRGFHDAEWGFFRPHNEHWSTVPIVFYRAVFSVFGMRTYWPYLLGLFAMHLVVVHSVWRLMRRAGVAAPLSTGVALVVGLFGAGAENLLWAFQIGFVGSVAAGLLLVLAVDEEGSRNRVIAVALGAVASLMFSGISVVMVGSLGLAAFARWGWRRAVAVVAPAALIYLAWLKVYGEVGLRGGTEQYRGALGDMPGYVWGGMAETLGRPLHSRRVGDVLLALLLVAVALRIRAWWRAAPELLAVAAAAPAMFAVISQGRGAIQDPSAGRYLYLCAALVLPLVGYAFNPLVRERVAAQWVAVAACLALTLSGIDLLRDHARYERTRELTLKGQMLASMNVGNEAFVSDTPDYQWATEVRVEALLVLRAKGILPDIAVNELNIASARLALQINGLSGPSGGPYDAPLGGGVADVPAAATTRPVRQNDDCLEVDLHGANLLIETVKKPGTPDRPNASLALFTVTPTSTEKARVFVPYPDGNAGPRAFDLTRGKTILFQDAVPGPALFQLPPGPNVICGLKWRTSK